MEKEKILVTSALPYANGPIHLGHLSGAYLPADIYVRYHRLKGSDVLYICGSDEHGVPITITADKEKVNPQTIIDRYHNINKEAFEKFGMAFDIYSRTSLPVHHENARNFFTNFYEQGLLKEKKTFQFYDEKAKMFLPDRYVEGTCPKCGYEEARSDECENCGSLYDSSELKNPKSKVTGETPKLKETSHWYFPLGKFQDRIEKYIDEMNDKYSWKDNVIKYCKGWFKEGLSDRAITRDLDWGIKVPLENADGKVIYVWFEAVLGYISATMEYSIRKGEPELWRNYWQDINTKYVAFIGKDNIVFHTIIFEAILMAWNDVNDDKFIMPQNVPANEFLNFEGKKFSKSRGWGIDVIDFLNLFPADSLRYTLASNLPENKDTDFYWKEFQSKNNDELADILGNFINRTFTFVHKNYEGKVPSRGELEPIDQEMLKLLDIYPKKVGDLLEKYRIKEATLEVMNLARAGNKYFNDSQPWATIKADRVRCATTLNICLETIYSLAMITSPIIPASAEKIFGMLNSQPMNWYSVSGNSLTAGLKLNAAKILFTKIEDDVIEKQMNELGKFDENVEVDEQISIDDFAKIKLKVAEVINAENIKKSDKLLKLQVMIGSEQRQVVAGIAKSYKPEQLIGKKVIIVSNLKAAKLFGNESQGMILAADNENGVTIIEVDPNVPSGAKVK